ncbi:hypothetical protein CSA80_04180 [Candidatus Saccharibacteria bacterium]|nr:MAG: hypothetical protein CR973_01745 [Candidatus Saccharibacteria bacterium]PID98872.1 MAG: hypothetical protein CSA80_04180 [Candidatus Saccharibacteria bacterium]
MSIETQPALHVLCDLDNVLGHSALKIVGWSNSWIDRKKLGPGGLSLTDYQENFPAMWGVTLEEGNERWGEFCAEHMPHIPPDEIMQGVIAGLPQNVLLKVLTSRAAHTQEVTRAWVRQHYPRFPDVLHTLTDWTNDPKAHLRTKADAIVHHLRSGNLPCLPDMIVDDEPKHVIACQDLDVDGAKIDHVVLYGDYPWNKEAQSALGVTWLPTPLLLEEYMYEAMARKGLSAA